MTISAGDCTDAVRTGLAGRIANDEVAAFPGISYPAGTNHQKGVNALAQAVVDALNNDKVGLDQVDTRAVVLVTGNQTGSTVYASATWTDLVLATTGTNGYTGKSTSRTVVARLGFSAYSQLAGLQVQARCLVDGSVAGTVYSFFYNTAADHRAWPFFWNLSTLAAGAHTIKVQVNPNGNTITTDTNDYICFEVGEIG